MPSPISIIVQSTGIRLDVLPDTTVEMNMGGISLLNLQDRTATYTNSFKLPRTPTNEQQFGFASSPTRSNKVSLAVTISKGLFSRSAILKVDSFDTDYSCTVSFGDCLELVTGQHYEYLYQHIPIMSNVDEVTFVRGIRDVTSGLPVFFLHTSQDTMPIATSKTRNLFVPISDMIDAIETATGITIGGTILTEADYLSSFLCLPNFWVTRSGTVGHYTYTLDGTDSGNLITDLLKEIALIFFCDVEFTPTSININKATLTGTPTEADGFTFTKSTVSGLAESNIIMYDVAKTILNKYWGADTITADGTGLKEVVKLKTYMPASLGGVLWNPIILGTDSDATNKIIIGTKQLVPDDTFIMYNGVSHDSTYGVDEDNYSFQMYDLSGYYSTLLDPIFLAPVLLDATCYLDPIQAENIMTSRLILSRQLQGLYWVDSMAYDLTSGRVKMKLIKLPQ